MPPRKRHQNLDVDDDQDAGQAAAAFIQKKHVNQQNGLNINNSKKISEKHDKKTEKQIPSNISKDWNNICLLTFLYVLQGIPLGLASSIPMLLQNRQVTYSQQAIYSFVHWPFSMKLLWAPLVDSFYSNYIGRRKTWMVPTQYLIGLFMLVLSSQAQNLIGNDSNEPNVVSITIVFFILCFLAATQDIAVDGWALTMLSRENVGYASTCNCVGQTAGYFIGYVVFLGLESASFCNSYLRAEPQPNGIVTLEDFLYFWGWMFLITTTLVFIFKKETDSFSEEEEERGVIETYSLLWKVVRLPNVKTLILFLLTTKIAFSAPDAVTGLKLTEHGVPKDKLAFLAIPLVPLQIILPLFISRYVVSSRPMKLYMKAFPYRVIFCVIFPFVVWLTPLMKMENSEFPFYYYALIIFVYSLQQITANCMFVSVMAFFARISDPAIGGSYMTLLNTLCNLGGNWPATLMLWLVDPLSSKACEEFKVGNETENFTGMCNSAEDAKLCKSFQGNCVTNIDGYYVECAMCIVIGFLWLRWAVPRIQKLQNSSLKSWKCS